MNFLKNLIFLVLVLIININCEDNKQLFRKDYTYLQSTNSFYKIHTIPRTWTDAKDRCALEGAKLFYPQDEKEAEAVISFWSTKQQLATIYIGISDIIAQVSTGYHKTIDGNPIDDVYNHWAPGEPNNINGNEDCLTLHLNGLLNDENCNNKYPFICNKPLADLEWDDNCGMPKTDYIFNQTLGKCYKFHLFPKSWTDAIITCSAEQSYLAIINSQAEMEYLTRTIANILNLKVSGNFSSDYWHLGFHNRDSKGWTTIKGVPLLDSGYATWGIGQPDNKGFLEQCGSMVSSGGLNDISCSSHCLFVCEHDVNTKDDRIEIVKTESLIKIQAYDKL